MTHEEKNIGGRAEHPGSEEQKISQMLGALKRVEAPKDFDFHLKARIANAKPSGYQRSGLLPILKYAMPLALFLLVGAGVMVNSSFNGWRVPETVNAPASPSEEPLRSDVTEQEGATSPTSSPEALTAETGTISERDTPLTARAEPGRSSPGDGSDHVVPRLPLPRGGSRDMGGGAPSATPIVPPEFRNSTNTSSNSSEVPSDMVAKPLNARDALESIGVEADLEENKWKVKSVKDSTIGGQMGLKAGDKIESIDGKAIDGKTVYKDGSFKVKTIRVRRGSTAVDLTLPKSQ